MRRLAIPFEWQGAVIRAAITLQLNTFDDTGAIVAAITTSIPEAQNSGRNWDYRYCWLRDSYFVVNALNRLGATETMESYLRYIIGIAAGAATERSSPSIASMATRCLPSRPKTPSRAIVVWARSGSATTRFARSSTTSMARQSSPRRTSSSTSDWHAPGNVELFERLEPLGRLAVKVHDQPDAGIWELRGTARVHTYSSVMCWAACDRLSRIAARLGLHERSYAWRAEADRIHDSLPTRCWNEQRGSYMGAAGGPELDASLLLLAELNFTTAGDPRFVSTVA